MNYIYMVLHVSGLTTYHKEHYPARHRHTPIFHNFNIGYSIFYTPRNTLFSKIMFYPLFTVFTVYYI